MNDPTDATVINAQRIERLRSNLLTKAENLMSAINMEPEDEEDHASNAATAETVFFLLSSFSELR